MSAEGAAVSLAAGVVSLYFTGTVLKNFLARRKPYNLMWGVGLLLFTLVMFVQVAAEVSGWSDGLFRAWYIGGTSLVAFLGSGSVYIAHRKLGHAFAAYVVILFVAFLAVGLTSATDAAELAAFSGGTPPSGEGWASASPRRMSPFFTIPGSVTLIGIALYGLVRHRLKYNAYIAGGAIVLAVGTGLARFGIPSLIYGAEFGGIALMFVGFWKAVEWAKDHRAGTGGGLPPTKEETPAAAADTVPK